MSAIPASFSQNTIALTGMPELIDPQSKSIQDFHDQIIAFGESILGYEGSILYPHGSCIAKCFSKYHQQLDEIRKNTLSQKNIKLLGEGSRFLVFTKYIVDARMVPHQNLPARNLFTAFMGFRKDILEKSGSFLYTNHEKIHECFSNYEQQIGKITLSQENIKLLEECRNVIISTKHIVDAYIVPYQDLPVQSLEQVFIRFRKCVLESSDNFMHLYKDKIHECFLKYQQKIKEIRKNTLSYEDRVSLVRCFNDIVFTNYILDARKIPYQDSPVKNLHKAIITYTKDMLELSGRLLYTNHEKTHECFSNYERLIKKIGANTFLQKDTELLEECRNVIIFTKYIIEARIVPYQNVPIQSLDEAINRFIKFVLDSKDSFLNTNRSKLYECFSHYETQILNIQESGVPESNAESLKRCKDNVTYTENTVRSRVEKFQILIIENLSKGIFIFKESVLRTPPRTVRANIREIDKWFVDFQTTMRNVQKTIWEERQKGSLARCRILKIVTGYKIDAYIAPYLDTPVPNLYDSIIRFKADVLEESSDVLNTHSEGLFDCFSGYKQQIQAVQLSKLSKEEVELLEKCKDEITSTQNILGTRIQQFHRSAIESLSRVVDTNAKMFNSYAMECSKNNRWIPETETQIKTIKLYRFLSKENTQLLDKLESDLLSLKNKIQSGLSAFYLADPSYLSSSSSSSSSSSHSFSSSASSSSSSSSMSS